jgi:hypothetical protein
MKNGDQKSGDLAEKLLKAHQGSSVRIIIGPVRKPNSHQRARKQWGRI